MKVTLEKNYRENYTLAELEAARKVIAACKEDSNTAAEYARTAAAAIAHADGDALERIVEATATTTRYTLAEYDAITDGSGFINVWVEGLAKTYGGYLEFGMCLTDIWNISGDPEADNEAVSRSYSRLFPRPTN